MLTTACCLVVGLGLELDLASGCLVVIRTYLYYFPLSLSFSLPLLVFHRVKPSRRNLSLLCLRSSCLTIAFASMISQHSIIYACASFIRQKLHCKLHHLHQHVYFSSRVSIYYLMISNRHSSPVRIVLNNKYALKLQNKLLIFV